MAEDNLVNLTEYRARTAAEDSEFRIAQRETDRNKSATRLLDDLGRAKRLVRNDRVALVRNLGQLVVQFDSENKNELTKRILESHWEKRKRYIRFPGESFKRTVKCAASGGDFASIIRRLIDERASKGFERNLITTEVIQHALKGTSFRRASQFHMAEKPERVASSRDAAYFFKELDRALVRFAEAAELADYFDLVSKYPLYPRRHYWSSEIRAEPKRPLMLRADREPNDDVYSWKESYEDDELHTWLPWWAPKCVIGHLYVPFRCKHVELPERVVAEIKRECNGTICSDAWKEDCLCEVEPHCDSVRSETKLNTAFHRLPIWLVTVPSSTNLVSCLWASTHYDTDDFQVEASLKEEGGYYKYSNITTPCFVNSIGEGIDADAVFFSSDHDNEEPLYICAVNDRVTVIGRYIDEEISNFRDQVFFTSYRDEVPEWLDAHPVQRLLQLTSDLDEASAFALSPRIFTKESAFSRRSWGWGNDDGPSVFRPLFSDVTPFYTKLRANTIAAYLLRNLISTEDSNVFEALKDDVLAKFSAAKEAINIELSKTRDAFNARYSEQ